jgi:hypothetical protein
MAMQNEFGTLLNQWPMDMVVVTLKVIKHA